MNAAPPRRITREEVVAEPWKFTSYQWRSVHGIHVPHMFEISPIQIGLMGKQARARYDKERTAQWQTSHDACNDFRLAVVAAFDAGKFEQYASDTSDDAKTAVFGELQRREAAELKARSERLWVQNRDMSGIKVGDVIYSIMSSEYAPIVKLSAKSARIPSRFSAAGTFKVGLYGLQWLSHNELEAQAKAGAETLTRKNSTMTASAP